ncbi:MAG: SOS response-associated peptidase [Bacteroidales bacterium]|nr:SOS response-associated peptidase [Bacteroidales bacterium]
MCGRYILVQKTERLEKRFNVSAAESTEWKPAYNISPGQLAPVITGDEPGQLQLFRFGMTPFWAKKPMYLINARAEGEHNKEDDPAYKGAKGIITKPSFRKPIRSQRCLIPADAFIEGTVKEKLSKPFVVYLKNNVRPFAFAGIWDEWINRETGELIRSFAIITTTANALLQKLPHHRSPVILEQRNEKKWLNLKLPLSDITKLLRPYPAELMNAYPIDPAIKNPRAEGKNLIHPCGERIVPEFETKTSRDAGLQGMGSSKKFIYDPGLPWGNRND